MLAQALRCKGRSVGAIEACAALIRGVAAGLVVARRICVRPFSSGKAFQRARGEAVVKKSGVIGSALQPRVDQLQVSKVHACVAGGGSGRYAVSGHTIRN
jgi:hypothetical protein